MRKALKTSGFWALLIGSLLWVVGVQSESLSAWAQNSWLQPGEALPTAQSHPLPEGLAQLTANEQGDYFSAIRSTQFGYLVWSHFPVRVFIEPATDARAQDWVEAVRQAVDEWSTYLPLSFETASELADIAIWRTTPPLQRQEPGEIRARSAETRYEIYIRRAENAPTELSHRFTILLRSGQTKDYITAAARHELGHALGIWGHSALQSDALYFSQVRHSPAISARDLNTLRRIYQQPTQLGWTLERSPSPSFQSPSS